MRIFGLDIQRRKNILGNTGDSLPVDLRTGQIYGGLAGGYIGGSEMSAVIRSDYENGFAPITAIVDEAIKRNIRLANPNDPESDISLQQPLWWALTHPNDRMDFIKFLGVLISGFLSLPEISLLLWHKSGDRFIPGCPSGGFKANNIAGFTVIPTGCKSVLDGKEIWTIPTHKGMKQFGHRDVITLKYSVLPDNGRTGVSPGSSSTQEAAIRDRLNQYERAFFDNGAKPSLIVTIHAANRQEFEAIRNSYEYANRGAGKQGGVVYQAIYDSDITGMKSSAAIEVTPVGAVNNTLAINDIVSYTSNTINSNYGVSPIIFGDASTTTYQNQQLVDKKFFARVQSVLVRLFTSLEHELARIIKEPLPFVFAWDSTDVELTDETKVKAETNLLHIQAIEKLLSLGASMEQIRAALDLNDTWDLTLSIPETVEPESVVVSDMEQPTNQLCACNHEHNAIPEDYNVKLAEPRLFRRLQNLLSDVTEQAVKSKNAISKDQTNELATVLKDLGQSGLDSTTKDIQRKINQSDIDVVLQELAFSETDSDAIDKRAEDVLNNYQAYLNEQITVAKESDPDGWAALILSSIAIAHRADMIAVGESKNAYETGQYQAAVKADEALQQNNACIIKTWDASGDNSCEFCASIHGTEAGIRDSFVPDGIITGKSGATIVLDKDYSDGTRPDAHAQCVCTWTFSVKRR